MSEFAEIVNRLEGEITDPERSLLESVIHRLDRNRRIRKRYKELRPKKGQTRSISQISEEEHISYRQVWRILYGG